MKNNIGIVIQARTGSLRLPSKIILPFYKSKSLIELLIEKLQNNFADVPIVLATSINEKDDILEKIALQKNVSTYRGSESDVLRRFIDAADKFSIDRIIRICSDNPFLDIEELKNLIEISKRNSADYISYIVNETPSIKTHFGFWAESVSLSALKKTAELTELPLYHEHVTNFVYEHPDLFKIFFIEPACNMSNRKNIRMTLDTVEDFHLLSEIYSLLVERYDTFGINEITTFIDNNAHYIDKMTLQIKKNEK